VKNCLRAGMLLKHYRALFMKQVLPRLASPLIPSADPDSTEQKSEVISGLLKTRHLPV